MFETYIKDYNEAVFEIDKELALEIIETALKDGVTPEQVVFDIIIPSIEEMMAEISINADTNLAQHFMTAQIAAEITEKMLAKFESPPEIIGRVIIGTSYGDLHSLGKRIVMGCLKSMMVDVVDLGVNVKAETFVDAAVAQDAQIIAISSMMVHTATGEEGSLKVRSLLKERGLEDKIKLVVGGAPYRFDHELYNKVGADSWAADGVTAAKIIRELILEGKS
ncbi:MAG: cobalamin-binding protein [Methylophaga sp.]|nr:cobalamin-binding protein [Methylophaga sp.]